MQSPAPVMMPMPHPQYLRSSISPHTLELQRAFRQLCGSGNLAAVVRLLEAAEREREPETERRRRSTEEDLDLTQGLVAAIYGKRIQMAEYLLKQGAAVDRSDVSNAAASVKSIALFELLIQHGWDINSSVMGGETILPSILDADEILVRWFLEHGARPNLGPPPPPPPAGSQPQSQSVNANLKADSARMYRSGTCLDVAAQKSSIRVFDMLLKYGAPRENCTALHMAAGVAGGARGGVSDSDDDDDDERIPMMRYLVERLGFDVNGSDVDVRGPYAIGTPLHYAIAAGSVQRIKFLLAKGADPHHPAGLAGSPYKMAQRSASEDIFALFVSFQKTNRPPPPACQPMTKLN